MRAILLILMLLVSIGITVARTSRALVGFAAVAVLVLVKGILVKILPTVVRSMFFDRSSVSRPHYGFVGPPVVGQGLSSIIDSPFVRGLFLGVKGTVRWALALRSHAPKAVVGTATA